MFFAIVGFLLHRQWRPPGMSRLAIVSYSPFFFFFFSFSNDFPNFIIKQQMGTIWNYLFDGWLHFSKTSTSMAKNIIPDPWSKLSKLFTESEDEPGRYESRDSNQLLGPRDSSSRAFVSISVQNWSSGFNHRAWIEENSTITDKTRKTNSKTSDLGIISLVLMQWGYLKANGNWVPCGNSWSQHQDYPEKMIRMCVKSSQEHKDPDEIIPGPLKNRTIRTLHEFW